ncbi:MAG: hypothetical protein VX009_01655 [Pseudomonadota bacterium]|nr:hypothetical protein [Pseudomonadota bacterium]
MSLKLARINLLIILWIFYADLLFANQIIFDKIELGNDSKAQKYISEIGDDKKLNFTDLFNKKNYKDIENFLLILPTKNSNPVIQDLIFQILTTKKKIDKNFISPEEDNKIFELNINKLFDTGRINKIELYYSQYPELKKNEFILKKMIEGNLLRNRHSEACKILDNKSDKMPEIFGKILIICDIINNRFEEAKLGLLLLKELNEPGNIFFIDLAYLLMSEKEIIDSEGLKKQLNEIKSLNPIIMSSLQFAEISPNYEQIENLSISGLLSILSNPTVDTDLKIYSSEILVKQERIDVDMLSQAYQLSRFKSSDVENSLKLYKTLSPAKARPLLFQSILKEKNAEQKLKKIIALLKISQIDNMIGPISNLVFDLVPEEKGLMSTEDTLLLSRMYQSKNKIFEANEILNNIENKDFSSEVYFRKIALLVKQFLNNGYLDENKLRDYLIGLNKNKKITSEKLRKIFMVLILNVELPQDIVNLISNFSFSESDKEEKGNLQYLFLTDQFSKNKDIFNSLDIFFKIVSNRDFEELSLLENYQVLKILKNLSLDNYYKRLLENILQ